MGVREIGRVEFQGIDAQEDVSCVAAIGPWLIIGPDEGANLHVLKRDDDEFVYSAAGVIPLGDAPAEIDIEGLATDGSLVYVAASHSLIRKKVSKKRSYKKNRKRLRRVEPDPARENIFRLSFDTAAGDAAGSIEAIGIKELIRYDEILGRFADIPSKENGIDIEGIAVADASVHLGFRGPVLRGNLAVVMIFDFDSPAEYELRFVDLDGLGIRDLQVVEDGFLVLAGPVGDGPGHYDLYHWTGEDGIPGEDRPEVVHKIANIPVDGGGKAEGFMVFAENDDQYELLFVYDSVAGGRPRLFAVDKENDGNDG